MDSKISDKPLSRFRKLDVLGLSDVLDKSLQRHLELKVVDELVEIASKSPYYTSRDPV